MPLKLDTFALGQTQEHRALASFVEVTVAPAAPTSASVVPQPQQAAGALAQMARHLGRWMSATHSLAHTPHTSPPPLPRTLPDVTQKGHGWESLHLHDGANH